ncbi:gamma-glutamyltransferase [uncultured Roseibium sp.]|uniref:gamma-glutamyltransferase n=1 Tax=uncultured Roseibium sp. TaxID=1936171 RepID=UPI00261A1367|nr:gamma-glutamyltransferase [uncultured Roseibium sp.]
MEPKGTIAAGHQLTAEAGSEMLRNGGNAFDAAIAALAMACVCEPVLASPGGGGFAMIRSGQSGATTLLDFFPQTPQQQRGDVADGFQGITADFGSATQVFHIGPATVASPGFFAGLTALHETGATLPFADLFAPAIRAAKSGHRITAYQHYLSTVVHPILTATKAATDLFAPSGDLPGVGSIFRNPGLAEMFEEWARGDWLHSGIADQILQEQKRGGHLGRADLEGYEVVAREPLRIALDSASVFLNPPPAACGALIRYALTHLERCDMPAMATALQQADEARRLARGDLAKLLDRPMRQTGTTHISTIDAQGNACSVTVSNGTGNGEIVTGYGFMLNNILGEEDVNPHGSAEWPANTRLASMMCPTLIETKDERLIALGSGGSSRIRSAIFQVVVRLCLGQSGLAEAVRAPRIHIENGHLDVEATEAGIELGQLENLFPDHRIWAEKNMFFGGVHAVSADGSGRFTSIGDERREGCAVIVE